ncbi:MAG TPA: FMN-binding negative transcriptional regulator [Burkholderiales bacterium]|nr:FMN-binding negative transcriptional regulator [Burkholderiales bacterium]
MYDVEAFREDRIEVLHALIQAHPLATLVAVTAQGLEANHIPLLIDPAPAPFGTLRGHVARANPLWRTFSSDTEVLVVFQGAQGYVTPSWYPTKAQTGKVVPTWNYVVVHARGPLKIYEDAEWLRKLVTRLTESQESRGEKPWRVTDAPDDYVDTMLKGIVGIEIPVRHLQGKWKMSQNRLPQDREGVVKGLETRGDETSLAMLQVLRR